MSTPENFKPVGILYHGQLAMMTGEAAKKIGAEAIALGPGENSPASHVIPVINGDPNNPKDVLDFSEHTGSFVLDTDHIRTEVLRKLRANGFPVYPEPDVTEMIQHRRLQKVALAKAGLPIAPWRAALSRSEYYSAFKHLGQDVIIKTAKDGFDGRGNMHVNSEEGLVHAWEQFGGNDVVIEKRLTIIRELAVMGARDIYGNRVIYPPVESFHVNGMLEYTFYPSLAGPATDQKVKELGSGILDVIGGPALIGMELIESEEYGLVVNEIAGRPHNTGHFTIEACATSQFENLVRIARKESVGPTDLVRPNQMVLMRNLNGGTLTNVTDQHHKIVKNYGGDLHWYHKPPREQTPPRKRGHITLFGPDRDTLMRNAEKAIQAIHFSI